MKYFLKISTITFLGNLLMPHIWALAANTGEDTLFPEQPCLVYDPSPCILNPFKMPTRSFGVGFWKFSKDLHEGFSFSNYRSRYFEGKSETPYYQDKVSLGFELVSSWHQPDVIAKQDENLNQSQRILARALNKHKHHVNALGTLKVRLPFYIGQRYIGLTLTPKLGVVYATLLKDDTRGLGITGGVGLGLEYYFSQWVGCYFEYCGKYSYVPLLASENNNQKPYHLLTTNFTVGIKTTLELFV